MKKLDAAGGREGFVEYWARYVKTHADEDWSRQQNTLIDSQIRSARASKTSPKQYLRVKGEAR